MIRQGLVLIVLGFGSFAKSATYITAEGSPTVGNPGSTTYKLTAHSEPGTTIIGFGFSDARQGILGFFGPMNQVEDEMLGPTIFNLLNPVFSYFGFDVSQDSQFSVNHLLEGNFAHASESSTSLRASFSYDLPFRLKQTNEWQFAQLSIPHAQRVEYLGYFFVCETDECVDRHSFPAREYVSGSILSVSEIPEPTPLALATLALLALTARARVARRR